MPTDLARYQHELTTDYEDGREPLVSFVFGDALSGYLTTTYPTIDGDEGATGDVQAYRGDGITFGEDFAAAKKVTFEIAVLTDREEDPHEAGADALALFDSIWHDQRLRDSSAKFAVLRSRQIAGRVRRTYGRPRRYAETTGQTSRAGMTPIVCDFQTLDGRWYDDEAQQVQATTGRTGTDGVLVANEQGVDGLWRFATLPSDNGSGLPFTTPDGYLPTQEVAVMEPVPFTIGGTEPTWPVVTFHAGSVAGAAQPKAVLGGLTIQLADTLAAGQSITVDTRPWSRGIMSNDGSGRAGRTTTLSTPLRRALLYPGDYTLVYDAIDPTGTSWCEVTWRNAYPRW